MLEEVVMHNETKNGEHLVENVADYPSIIVITCMLSFFSVVGTTGNAFVLYVFSRKKDKNTSTIFILALASIDFVTCLFLIPFTIVVEFMYKRINSDAMCKMYQFFITSHVPFSAFIMVAIAFDRYFCICRPWMKFIDIRFAKRTIVCLLAFSLTLGLITSLAYGVYHRKPTVLKNITEDRSNISTHTNVSEFYSSLNPFDNSNHINNCTFGRKESSREYENAVLECKFNGGIGRYRKLNTSISGTDFVFDGFCYPNEIILSKNFRRIYQTFYALLFLIAFIIVFILYALIYRSILVRRSKKLQTSLTTRYSNGKKTSLLTCMFSRQQNIPEVIKMEPSDSNLNNQRRGSKMTGSDTSLEPVSTATCQTSTHGPCNAENLCIENFTRKESYKGLHRNLSADVIKEENENSSAADCAASKIEITANDLKPPDIASLELPKKRRKRNGRFLKVLGKKEDNTKNTNKRRILAENENGEIAHYGQQENFKVTTYNICRKDTRKSVREKHRLANIKTAGILFIVTVVFIIAFLPAWLMATKLIPPNMIVFYTYFIYNVANPVIYAFFNQSFQQEMKTVLKCSENV